MPTKEWRYLDIIRGRNSFPAAFASREVNAYISHGMWVLFVNDDVRVNVVAWLEQQLESGPFVLFGFGETDEGSSFPKSYVFAVEEGYLTRRHLWARMSELHNLGVVGPWLYEDVGSKRHTITRRILSGQSTRSNVTEVDYRESAEMPTERVIPFPRS